MLLNYHHWRYKVKEDFFFVEIFNVGYCIEFFVTLSLHLVKVMFCCTHCIDQYFVIVLILTTLKVIGDKSANKKCLLALKEAVKISGIMCEEESEISISKTRECKFNTCNYWYSVILSTFLWLWYTLLSYISDLSDRKIFSATVYIFFLY